MTALPLTAESFSSARARVAGRIHTTPLLRSTLLGRRIGAELHVKCENLQKTGSFKVRGVLNKLMQLDEEARSRGVVTISAGNHAQALAWGAREAGLQCVVVMPANASATKAAASRDYGAEVVLHGDVFEAFEKSHELERERGLTFIHPFDDPEIIAGHGSAGLEILEQLWPSSPPSPRAEEAGRAGIVIVVPIGGGGLISGIAAAVKLQQPSVRIYGVEPEGAAAMRLSLDQGQPAQLDAVNTIARGLAPPMAGKLNYALVKQYVDDVVVVTDEEIIAAMEPILSRTKLVVEPSGAAGVAALLAGKIPLETSDRVVAVLSGGNVEMEELGGFVSREP